MLLFGHLGVTLGIFFVLGLMLPRLRELIGVRHLAVGAMLPDLVDKPLGRVILAETLANGRIIGHTLVFSLFLALVGLYYYEKKKNTWPLAFAAGSLFHILEDGMWANPKTLYWPLLGWDFPRGSPDFTGLAYFMEMLARSFDPECFQCFISELLGLGIIIIVIADSIKRDRKKKSEGV